MTIIINLLNILSIFVPLLLGVAFVTIAERKGMASMQRRLGPNYVGYYGLLQPFSDAIKLIVKETIIPIHANKFLFVIGPIITLIFSFLGWCVIPLHHGLTMYDYNYGILYSIAVSSIGVYGILIAGWSANSKYAFLGSLRSTAQLISYELILSTCITIIILIGGDLNFTSVVKFQQGINYILPLLPIFIVFLIGALAECNRTPFDLPEAESELVSGFNTEHSSTIFVFFFLAEYSNVLLMSTLISIYFLGGYEIPTIIGYTLSLVEIHSYPMITLLSGTSLGIKSVFIVFFYIWTRASFPRIRYDQLMYTCWSIILPIVFGFVVVYPVLIYLIGGPVQV